jgi:predicted nucleotidyltransferase
MEINDLLINKREEILQIAARHGVQNVRIFGSAARGEARPDSDIDFLVTLEIGRSLLDLARLLRELEALLGRNVDVVTEAGLRPRIRPQVLKEARPL